MKMRSIFLTLFLSICFSVSAQEDAFQNKLIEYMGVNGTYDQYSNAYDRMFDVLVNQYKSADVPQAEWDAIVANKATAVDEIVGLLASAYRKYFNAEDVVAFTAFYKSEAGIQRQTNSAELTVTQREEISNFFKSDAGQKLIQSQGGLQEDIQQISEYWSRDLYKATVEGLAAKGYHPQQ